MFMLKVQLWGIMTCCGLHPQALYKLYNVAANHRHLYHHAFPGHQVEEAAAEQDKKKD